MTVTEKSGLTAPTTDLEVAHLINAIEDEEFWDVTPTLAQLAQRKGYEVIRYGEADTLTDWVLSDGGWLLNNEPNYAYTYTAVSRKPGTPVDGITFSSIDTIVAFLVRQEDVHEDVEEGAD